MEKQTDTLQGIGHIPTIIEAEYKENISDYITRLFEQSLNSSTEVWGGNFNSKTKFIVFNPPITEENKDVKIITGKIIDPEDAFRRGKSEFEFSIPYDGGEENKLNLIYTIKGLFKPSQESFSKRKNTTEEGKKRRENTKKEIGAALEENNKKSNAYMQDLEKLDFKNYEQVLNRFYNAYESTPNIGTTNGLKLKQKLQEEGYDVTSKECPYLDENNEEQVAKGIIWHVYTSPFIGEFHGHMIHLIDNWRKSFRKKQYAS